MVSWTQFSSVSASLRFVITCQILSFYTFVKFMFEINKIAQVFNFNVKELESIANKNVVKTCMNCTIEI